MMKGASIIEKGRKELEKGSGARTNNLISQNLEFLEEEVSNIRINEYLSKAAVDVINNRDITYLEKQEKQE